MNRTKSILLCGLCVITLNGCSNHTSKQDVGTVTGGVTGALIGSQIGGGAGQLIALGAGTLVGALIGGSIGKSMDQTDQAISHQAIVNAPTGHYRHWRNPESGITYTIVPVESYTYHGKPCRTYIMTARMNGKIEKIYGRACKDAQGNWQAL